MRAQLVDLLRFPHHVVVQSVPQDTMLIPLVHLLALRALRTIDQQLLVQPPIPLVFHVLEVNSRRLVLLFAVIVSLEHMIQEDLYVPIVQLVVSHLVV